MDRLGSLARAFGLGGALACALAYLWVFLGLGAQLDPVVRGLLAMGAVGVAGGLIAALWGRTVAGLVANGGALFAVVALLVYWKLVLGEVARAQRGGLATAPGSSQCLPFSSSTNSAMTGFGTATLTLQSRKMGPCGLASTSLIACRSATERIV